MHASSHHADSEDMPTMKLQDGFEGVKVAEEEIQKLGVRGAGNKRQREDESAEGAGETSPSKRCKTSE